MIDIDLIKSNTNLLIIDDSESTCEIIKAFLEQENFSSIQNALTFKIANTLLELENASLETAKFQIILLDIHLPDGFGIDICKNIKQHHCYKDTPILIVTGDKDVKTLEASFSAGAMDFIKKPLTKIELAVRIKNSLETVERERQLKNLAHYDALTKLTNRMLLMDRIERCLKRSVRDDLTFAILFIDINHFKQLNDTLGHAAGDAALIHLANVMQDCVRMVDTVARLAGDEFVILLENITNESSIRRLIQRLYKTLAEPLILEDNKWNLSISIGTAIYPDQGDTVETLLEYADHKMYEDKKLKHQQIAKES